MTQKQEVVSSLRRRQDCSLYDWSGPIVGLLRNGRFFAVVVRGDNELGPEERELGKRVIAMGGLFIVAHGSDDVAEAFHDALTEDASC